MDGGSVRLVEVAVWWAVLVGVWISTVPALTAAEVGVGVVAALPCAVAATASRAAIGTAWHVRARWIGWLLPLVIAVLVDTVRLPQWAARAVRRDAGGPEFTSLRLHRDGDPAREAGHRAVATAVVASSPSTVVVDETRQHHALVIHPLGDGYAGLRRAVRR
jgi:multisubunit Na+/H+ antiporter MnhE subunit